MTHIIVYGPLRSDETLPELLRRGAPIDGLVVEVRYLGSGLAQSCADAPNCRFVEVADPGQFEVMESGAGNQRKGLSNSRRQFVMMNAGLGQLQARPGDDVVLLFRSDLEVRDEARVLRMIEECASAIGDGQYAMARLTVNSINPLSFTGHRMHASDWMIATTLERARRLVGFDPEQFANGRYGRFEELRKGKFCFGALSAEQLLTVGAGDLDLDTVARRGLNALSLPWSATWNLLRRTRFVSPARVGLGLSKWEYLYRPAWGLAHPFGPGPRGRLRRVLAWLFFWTELLPETGPLLLPGLFLKAALSWTLHSLKLAVLSLKAAGEGAR